jgi:dethiobiotin synthetase
MVESLKADYWKPVQTGKEEGTDSETIKKLISNTKTIIHPERYCLNEPASPHIAAEMEGIHIALHDLILPETGNTLIIEGAGGLMVPLNSKELMIDFIKQTGAEVVLVIRNYLGCINHTLLSLEALEQRKIPVKGLIINGESDYYLEQTFHAFSRYMILAKIALENRINADTIKEYARIFSFNV